MDTGYTVNSDTTWGDLYRYYEPETFETLPAEIQMQYDNTLFENLDTKSPQFEYNDGDMEIVSVFGTVYHVGDEHTGAE